MLSPVFTELLALFNYRNEPFQSIALLVCLKHISMRRALYKNLNPFTSNYAVVSLPAFLRDEMRELNKT